MVIDTSAIVAVFLREEGADRLTAAIEQDRSSLMSAASSLETAIVLESRFGAAGAMELDLLVQRLGIRVLAVDLDQLAWARHAYRNYGKGRHPAALNFGDCFSYTLAKITGEPLLFKGQHFSRSDIPYAMAPGSPSVASQTVNHHAATTEV